MVSWRPPLARRNAEPNRPAAPPPTKMASYSRPSSPGVATFHRPSVLSCGCATMSSMSSAHSPTVSGAPSPPRSLAAGGPSALTRARSEANPSPGFRTSIIAHPSSPGIAGVFSITSRARLRAGHARTKYRPDITPADQGSALIPQGLQRSPGPGGELQVEVDVGVVQLHPGELADPLQPVLERALVHGQLGRGGVVVAAVLEVLGQRAHQLGLPAGVVVDQAAEPFPDELLDIGEVGDGREHAEDAEPGVLAGAAAR